MTQPRTAYSSGQKTVVVLLAGIVPLALGLAGVALMALWSPELPQRLAIHWNGAGEVDGYADFAGVVALLLGVTAVLAGTFTLSVVTLTDRSSPVRGRILVALGIAVSTAVTTGIVASVGLQRGGAVPESLQVGQWLLIGLGIGAVLGAIAYPLTPSFSQAPSDDDEHTDPIELSADERAVWTGVVAPGRRFVALYAAIVLLVVGSVAFGAVDQPALVVVFIVVLAVSASVLRWRVTVSRSGFTARGTLGLPVLRVPMTEVEGARVVQVGAMSEFGGWGLRFGGGRIGVILRSGEAVEVERTRGRAIVVTVDDAETAAALLNGFVARASR